MALAQLRVEKAKVASGRARAVRSTVTVRFKDLCRHYFGERVHVSPAARMVRRDERQKRHMAAAMALAQTLIAFVT